MTEKLIFKMELFKFLRDKSFLITAGVIAVINTILTLVLLNATGNVSDYYYDSSATATLIATLGGITVMIFLGNIIFAIIYPFHMISMDYKNNVMAMMVASGVNRKKLFFAKIGAIFVCTLLLMLAITLVPLILCLIKLSQMNELSQISEVISSIFYYTETTGIKLVLLGFINYINSLMIIATASIAMKGKNISFLCYIGLNIVNSIVFGILNMIPTTFMFSNNGVYMYQLLMAVLSIVLFAFISLKLLEKQNL